VNEVGIGKVAALLTMNHVEIQRIIRTNQDSESGRFTCVFQVIIPKTLRCTPMLMVSIIQGVEGVSLSDIVLMDDHDAKHYLKKITADDMMGPSSKDLHVKPFMTSKYRIPDSPVLEMSDTEFGTKFMEDSTNIATKKSKRKLKKMHRRSSDSL